MRKPQILLFHLMWLFLSSGTSFSPTSPFSAQFNFAFFSGLPPAISAGMPDETGTIPTFNPTETPPPPSPPAAAGTPQQSGGVGSWCTASQNASPVALQVALDYACGYGGADCSSIQPGGSCSDPDTLHDHASFAFNDYYQKNPTPTSCVFGGAARLTSTDPSSGTCHYSSNPSTQPTPAFPPPSLMSPETPTTPGGPSVFGTDPTESRSEKKAIEWLTVVLFHAVVFILLFRMDTT